MGFDNECILNIQSLAGEYFCPVCRLLVYPNEALQSQCTHLYCKPCLTYVVSTTKACPYDGYLVTEADAKPLVESNKTLAETIGKIGVHCLYHRSGCPWQGPLSDCTSHCFGCAFGNSPVVCNRCGIQIVHCQVQEHAQSCPGVQPQAQQAEGATSASGTATSTDQTQAATQIGTATSQSQVSQTASATIPGADPNSQAQAVVQAAAPTADQWYQQQYQQYYQQYPGYDPYQQQYQQYYPYQQPGIPQPQQPAIPQQQQPLQANPPYGTVQSQQQAYLQPPLVSQPQLHTQQSQSHAQPQPVVQPPLVQAPMAVQTQNQTSVNQQLQFQPAVAPHSQIQAQTYPSAHGQAQLPPQAYFQAQMTQYQQPQVQQITQTQLQQNPQLHPSQPMNATVQSQTQLPSSNASAGHHLFPQSHPHQPVLSAAPQQRTVHLQSQGAPNSQSQNHVQTQIQFPLQPPLLRPPPFQTTIPNQPQTALLPSPSMISAQQPPVHSFAQQPGIPPLQRPLIQPVQQLNPQQYFQNQPYVQQTPATLSQLRPQGQSHSFPQHIRASNQSQQNVVLSQGMQHIQPSNLVGRPMMPSHGVLPQPYAQTVGGVLPRPMYPPLNHQSSNQNNIGRTNNQVQPGANSRPTMTTRPAEKEAELSAKNGAQDVGVSSAVVADSEAKTVKSEVDIKSTDDGNKPSSEDRSYQGTKEIPESKGMLGANGESESKPTLKEEGVDSTLEDLSNGKLGELVAEGAKDAPSSGMKLGEHKEMPPEEAQLHGVKDKKLQKVVSSTEEGSQTVSISSAPIGQVQAGGLMQPSHPGSAILQQKPGAPPLLQVPSSGPPHHILGSGQPLAHVRPQGPGHVPGHPSHLSEHFQSPRGNLGFAASSANASQHGPYNQSHAPPHSGAPRGPPFAPPPSAFDSHGGIMARAAPYGHEGQMGLQRPAFQMEQGATGQPSGIISNMLRMNGNPGFESSSTLGLRDERFKALPDGRLNPFPGDPTRVISRVGFEDDLKQFPRPSFLDSEPLPKLGNYSSRAFDRRPFGVNYDTRLNIDPAAGSAPRFLSPYGHAGLIHANDTIGHPDFGGRRLMDGLARRSPIRDYPGIPSRFRGFGPDDFDGREFHRFGDPLGREFHDNRFPNQHFRRGEFEGPGNMRVDDRMRNDLIGQDGHLGHLQRGEHLGPHNLPGHLHMREHVGFGVHPRHAGPGSFESFIGNRANHPRLGEPGFRSSFSLKRFPNDGTYAGELESFDHSRKRKPASMGWCRICKVNCETVEGLDVHSQTREHQRMAMEMVQIIKQNAKKQKLTSGDQSSIEDANKSKITSSESQSEKS
ncbi:PREDICTED: uncharacterized protein LOC101314450 [Fragaria vesca subsp. vesca]|uniref:uncharacterized protein LOC101314450 n=1 Tax=Fragaria vesca subsp. vesca TaxID=101020 RepID=UPI0002C306D9|nr:PREDICTED: uncharacterized protein LOC101314450 [Fragaria vesca subsp. vesca]